MKYLRKYYESIEVESFKEYNDDFIYKEEEVEENFLEMIDNGFTIRIGHGYMNVDNHKGNILSTVTYPIYDITLESSRIVKDDERQDGGLYLEDPQSLFLFGSCLRKSIKFFEGFEVYYWIRNTTYHVRCIGNKNVTSRNLEEFFRELFSQREFLRIKREDKISLKYFEKNVLKFTTYNISDHDIIHEMQEGLADNKHHYDRTVEFLKESSEKYKNFEVKDISFTENRNKSKIIVKKIKYNHFDMEIKIKPLKKK